MAKLVAFYSRADENYFGGSMKHIEVGNTEKAARKSIPSVPMKAVDFQAQKAISKAVLRMQS